MIRLYGVGPRSRAAGIALAAAALALGVVFVAFGIVLLLGLAAVGTVVGVGTWLFRSLTRRRPPRIDRSGADRELDPALEVFPASVAPAPPRSPHNPARREGAGSRAEEQSG